MKEIGAVFRQIRESRHISLEEATGGEFSRSMLSRFERGENDLTTQRFFQALQQIKTSLSEFSHLAGIDQHSFIPKLLKEHYENMSLEHDQALYQSYKLAYQKDHKKEDLLASIILKAQMLGNYPEVELVASQEELDFLYDYLFSVMIWGNFELSLFSLTSPLFSSQLYRQYTEELVQREDFKLLLDSSLPALNSIFLNGFFLAISSKEFEDATYFDKKILISHDEIVTAARELGQKLTEDYQGKNPILVGILKGSVPFMAELIKHIDTHIELDFMLVSSYHGGTSSSGVINIIKDMDQDIKGRDILFVEDIIDTGKTLKSLKELFEGRQPASVKIATLLDKPEGRLVEIEADYTCFTIPNEFVVGYGLDYDENYRNLPYIGVLKEEVYSK